MSKQSVTNGKHVKVGDDTHDRIYHISQALFKDTGLRHPAYLVVRMAIGLLEDQLGIAPQPTESRNEKRD